MLKTLNLHFKQNKALLIAIAVSMLIHSLFLIGHQIEIPDTTFQQHTIEARLIHTTPVKKKPHATIVPTAKKALQDKPVATPALANEKQITASESASLVDVDVTKEALKQVANPVNETSETKTDSDIAVVPESVADTDSIEAYFSENPSAPSPQQIYHYIESEFEIKRGNDQTPAATAIMIFKKEATGAYSISSNTEAIGLASLFFNALTQTSEGTITEYGLQPSYYQYQYGKDERKLQFAQFSWSDGVIELNTAKGKETVSLTPGTQDLLSFMYQFMFVPPLENMQLNITNGKNLRHYAYEFVGEEKISTGLGILNTIHILHSGDKEAKTELWLATAYQYIPVKIRKTEKNGEVIEQTIRQLSTTMPE
ncbi:MAG: hypothetical protein CVU29_03515 [Betaproteobacteria bacterium HGW-Betaproteobacteria-22]|nr:MAG: hypothetical protein CVU29_03515 [Betaproteobacteria bacterium HGW-Betaproteobacteria-22]